MRLPRKSALMSMGALAALACQSSDGPSTAPKLGAGSVPQIVIEVSPTSEDGGPDVTVAPHPVFLHTGQHSVDFVFRPAAADAGGLAASFTCRIEFTIGEHGGYDIGPTQSATVRRTFAPGAFTFHPFFATCSSPRWFDEIQTYGAIWDESR